MKYDLNIYAVTALINSNTTYVNPSKNSNQRVL